MQRHISDFFASQKNKFAGAKIDVQVTVKGDVDLLQPRKSSRPALKSDVWHVKKEESTLPLTVKHSKSDDDEDIIVMTMKKEVVEIEISNGENPTVKSEVKSEVSDAEDWIVKTGVKSENDDEDHKPDSLIVKTGVKSENNDEDHKPDSKLYSINEEGAHGFVKFEQHLANSTEDLKDALAITGVKSEGNGGINLDIKDECESSGDFKLEVKKEELSEVSERNLFGSSSTNRSIIRSPTFIPDVSSLQQQMC